MLGYPKFLPSKEYVIEFFKAGIPVYIIDFEQEDQRNVCCRITHESMLTPEKIFSRKVYFVLLEESEIDK